jgi:hypothetical protein
LTFSGKQTVRAYFGRWAQLPETASALDDSWRSIAETILAITTDSDVYIPYEIVTHPVVRYLIYDRYPSLEAAISPIDTATLRQPKAIFSANLPPQGPFVLLTGGAKPRAWTLQAINRDTQAKFNETFGPRVSASEKITDRQGRPMAVVIPLSASDVALFPDRQGPSNPLERRFANGVKLLGYSIAQDTLTPGSQVILTLYWQADHLVDNEFEIFVHLVDRTSVVRSQGNSAPLAGSYTGTLWAPGEIVPDPHTIILPADLAPGKVRFEIGLAKPGLLERLSIVDPQGREYDDLVTLGTSQVVSHSRDISDQATTASSSVAAASKVAEEMVFAEIASLQGYQVSGTAQPGGTLRLTLDWHALERIDEDYTVFVHLVDSTGRIVAQNDHQPQNGANPTSWWSLDETVRDEMELDIPPDAPSGPYSFRIGLYQVSNGIRLQCDQALPLCVVDYLSLPATPSPPS